MSLAKIFEEIGERLPDSYTYRVGGDETIARQDAPPRIVMEIGSETFEAPHGQGQGANRLRSLCTRVSSVRVHVWAKTMSLAEAMVEEILNIVQEIAPGSHRRGSGEWKGDSISDRGVVYVFDLQFLIQVTRTETYALVATLPITPVLDIDPTS
jgi:hypothetical protein